MLTDFNTLKFDENQKFHLYTHSGKFEEGLLAAQTIWTLPEVFKLSGLYIYVNQISIPPIMAVERKNATRFDCPKNMLRDLERMKHFLGAVVGLAQEEEWQGGLKNPLIVRKLAQYGAMHWRLPDIAPWMMCYMGRIIATAPLKVLPASSLPIRWSAPYYEYMQYAWLIMGVEIGNISDPAKTEQGVRVEDLAQPTPNLAHDLVTLKRAYEIKYGRQKTTLLWSRVLVSLEKPIQDVVTNAQLYD